jgi:Ni/Fe-hydrogenase subunit HybB-like protein
VAGLSRIAGGTMLVYLFLEAIKFVHGQKWEHLGGGWGAWYALEIVGLVAVPMALLLAGSSRGSLALMRTGAVLTLVGVALNRLNVSVIAFKWYEPVRYVPTWMEVVVTAAVISAEIWVFRWIVSRMPVLGFRPEWAERQDPGGIAAAPATA